MTTIARNWQDGLTAIVAVAFGSLLLAVVAFGRPTTHAVVDDVPYRQEGEFSYSATAPDVNVYDGPNAVTGDPVYRRLSDSFTARFLYRLTSERGPVNANGTFRLLAEVSDDNGWKRTVELQPETQFTGSAFEAKGTLLLQGVQTLITTLEAQTGVHNQSYTLAIIPEVSARGTAAGQSFVADFAPRLSFRLDELQVHLAGKDASAPGDPLRPAAELVAKRSRTEASSVPLLFFEPSVVTARLFAMLGLVASLLAAGFLLVIAGQWFQSPDDVSGRVEARYGSMLVRVRGLPKSTAPVVDVTSVDDLARIAEREGCMLLQEARPGVHCYYVHLPEITYRFQAERRPAGEEKAA